LVLESLYGSPLVTVKELSKELGLSYSNANALVDRLCDLEILKEITGQRRNRIFTYESYLSLFKEQENVP
jgi:DNA-binding MarR family transcriptional regulator